MQARDPFDPDYLRSALESALGPVLDDYFRVRLIGWQRLPQKGPLVLAANHSGNAFPYDAMVLDGALWRKSGCDPAAKVRSMYEPELSSVWWMRPFGIDDFWRRCGGVDQTFENFDALLARGDRTGYYPEGVPGIGKGFARRYRLQHFHTSFAVLAARHAAPVYPVSIVNAEWIAPWSFTLRPLDRLMQRLFNVPFLPLPWAVVAILWPWVWWLAFPARIVIKIGPPIDVAALARAEGVTDFARPPKEAMQRVADRVRSLMQEELDGAVAKYGRHPFNWRTLRRSLRAARGRRWRVLPVGWCAAMVRQERDRRRPPARSRLHALVRDLDLVAYYLPLGWPLLSLFRRLRRPPCGYRGLTEAERRQQEGAFVWRLSERPLPPRRDDAPSRPPAPPVARAAGPAAP